MFRIILCSILSLVICMLSAVDVKSQQAISNSNLSELPIILSWDKEGIRITTKTRAPRNLLDMTPFKYLDQIGNDLIKVALDTENTPVVIDLTDYYKYGVGHHTEKSRIKVYMPKLVMAEYNEPESFVLELKDYVRGRSYLEQTFIFKGLDVFYVGLDQAAEISANQNRITVNVEKSKTQHLQLKGGTLNLFELEEKIPDLCNKYNSRYFGNGRANAFICLRDCKNTDPNTPKHQRHGRKLITKYNITDFEDSAVSFLDEVIITKKGVGMNLKSEIPAKQLLGKKIKKATFEESVQYIFFPWYEFVNLSFAKYNDEHQLLIKNPYNQTYVYSSRVHFSNVELIQFFSEMKTMLCAKQHHVIP